MVGPANIREEVTLGRSGNTYTGTFTIDQFDLAGNSLAHVAGRVTATRITVDTPPLPDPGRPGTLVSAGGQVAARLLASARPSRSAFVSRGDDLGYNRGPTEALLECRPTAC